MVPLGVYELTLYPPQFHLRQWGLDPQGPLYYM